MLNRRLYERDLLLQVWRLYNDNNNNNYKETYKAQYCRKTASKRCVQKQS